MKLLILAICVTAVVAQGPNLKRPVLCAARNCFCETDIRGRDGPVNCATCECKVGMDCTQPAVLHACPTPIPIARVYLRTARGRAPAACHAGGVVATAATLRFRWQSCVAPDRAEGGICDTTPRPIAPFYYNAAAQACVR